MLLKDKEHETKIKMERHKTLIEMLRTKNCVYVAEIDGRTYIKIGSSKHIGERNVQLNKQYKDLIFLEIFECNNFRVPEICLKNMTNQ